MNGRVGNKNRLKRIGTIAAGLLLLFGIENGGEVTLAAGGFSDWFRSDFQPESEQVRGQEAVSDLPVYYLPQPEDAIPQNSFAADFAPQLGDESGGFYTHSARMGNSLETGDDSVDSGEYTMTLRDQWQEDEVDFGHYLLPDGFIYPSYLAGRKEPRLQSLFDYDDSYGWIWDITLGGRVPLYRFGTQDPVHPEGFQIDMEGAALLRLDFERGRQLAATDYRAGLPLSYGTGKWQYKFAYYHVSSHLGDQYLLDDFREKVHYVRDELVFGTSWKPIDPIRLYGEVGWAFNTGQTTDPWEFQFGAEYSPLYTPEKAKTGTPFAAANGHLFEELNFGGYFDLQFGWQWRSWKNSRFRLGFEYYNGCDDQFQFHTMYQRKYGVGFWYDF